MHFHLKRSFFLFLVSLNHAKLNNPFFLLVRNVMRLQLFSELWNGLEQIGDQTVVGHLENWSLRVLVDSHNGL